MWYTNLWIRRIHYGKIGNEIKILNIDVESTREKLDNIGATFKTKKEQKIYTYDIMTINYRFEEAILLLKSDNELLKTTATKKLAIVLDEFEDLVNDKKLNLILNDLNVDSFSDLLLNDASIILKKILGSSLLLNEIKKFEINPNKWVRLRKSNDKVELTVKHIYDKNNDKIQKVKEFEIQVSDLDETNKLLEEVGLVRRNYQEKIRYSYVYKSAEIELDIWPNLEPYMEIECDDATVIDEIVSLLEFNDKRIVSMNTEGLYREKGIDILKISDLKF